MGFLDNSGDIILDAVLTDLGRKRMAEGNFRISKFALGDDEVNYGLYNKNHPSGSAYYDLEIIQTPVLESFTNNTSTMNSRLVSLTSENILYLPVTKLNTLDSRSPQHSSGIHLVAVDNKTQGTDKTNIDAADARVGKTKLSGIETGVLYGLSPSPGTFSISVDQGFDNAEVPTGIGNYQEEAYIIQMDGRLGSIVNDNGDVIQSQNTSGGEYSTPVIDDDGIVLYTVRLNDNSNIVQSMEDTVTNSPIAGAKGTRVTFKVKAAEVLTQNQSFFDRIGFTTTVQNSEGDNISCKAIDTNIRIIGVKYGYTIDVPIRFIKDIS